MERRLAAVLIADVEGYGRLSQVDEEGTRVRFQANLREIFEPQIGAHHGRLVKTMGDGILVEFQSVINALRCAVDIQRVEADRNAAVPDDQKLEFRIAINLGDVIIEGDDIHGNGVNIAHRLNALARPGGVVISGTAYDQVTNRLDVGYEFLGEQRIKNIAEPIRVYRVLADSSAARPAAAARTSTTSLRQWRWPVAAGMIVAAAIAGAAAWWQPWTPAIEPAAEQASQSNAASTTPADDKPSLVVLPFDNLSDDKEQGYLADGITEDLTTELARIPGLFVISRNAAFTYRDKDMQPGAIAAELGVRYLLEGSVRRAGEEMRINAQLIDSETGGHLWADRFDGRWADVFSLQDKIIASIAAALKLRLVTGQSIAETSGGTSNPAAYDAYLRGLDLYIRGTPEDIVKAVAAYEEALSIDPKFGAANADLAWIYFDADDARARALAVFSMDDIWTKISSHLEAAAKHPSPSYYQLIAHLLVREGKSGEAITALQKAVALDPSQPWTLEGLSHALTFNGQPKNGLTYLDAALQVDPGWTDWRYYLAGLAAFGEGRFDDTVVTLKKIDVQSPVPWPKFMGLQVLLSAYGHLGRKPEIAATREKLEAVKRGIAFDELNWLLTQHFFVFENEADIERLLAGLGKAGVPELPAGIDPQSSDRLTGPQIEALILGRELRGRQIHPEIQEYRQIPSADASVTTEIGSWSNNGTSWVQGDFMCAAYPKDLTECSAILRNPSGTQDQKNEYLSIWRRKRLEFSVVN